MGVGMIERGEDGSSLQEEEDSEFEGGLKIPGSIWNKLNRYQNNVNKEKPNFL